MTYQFLEARWHGGSQGEIRRIVIHGTVSPTVDGGAASVAHDFHTTHTQKSAHYVVDPSKIIQCVADSDLAFHDGTNVHSIGIELCDMVDGKADRWSDIAHIEMLTLAARLCAQLCEKYSIPVIKIGAPVIVQDGKGICGHVDMRDAFPANTTHYDPGVSFPWPAFIGMIGRMTDVSWPDKMRDYAANKDHPPMVDSTMLMEWTVAKVKWTDDKVDTILAGIGTLVNTQNAILAKLTELENQAEGTPSV